MPLKELLNASQSWSIQWVFGSHIILYDTIKTKTAKKRKEKKENREDSHMHKQHNKEFELHSS